MKARSALLCGTAALILVLFTPKPAAAQAAGCNLVYQGGAGQPAPGVGEPGAAEPSQASCGGLAPVVGTLAVGAAAAAATAVGLARSLSRAASIAAAGGRGSTAAAASARAAASPAGTAGPRAASQGTGSQGANSLRPALPRGRAVPAASRRLCADPVDVATGEMVMSQTDVELSGALPLLVTRTHVSSYREGRWFGPSWASTLDQRVEVDAQGVCYSAPDGVVLVYPTPEGDAGVLPVEGPRWPLTRSADGGYEVADLDRDQRLHFGPSPVSGVLPLTAVTTRNGHRIDVDHDGDGVITKLRHSAGREVTVETSDGRITTLTLRGRDGASDTVLMRYGYDAGGRLTEVMNSSNAPLRFTYDADGRITRWEDRNGSWFGYGYDADGRCVRTSGSGGCLDGTFVYDLGNRVTVVTNSLGHQSTFRLNQLDQVVREVDPLGNATVSEWDRYDRLLARTDPLGRTSRYRYDGAGNLVAIVRPDGSQATAEYNDRRRPVALVDPGGAVWRGDYDDRGNLTGSVDPAGATTTYAYDDRGNLVATTDALGQRRRIETDAAGSPVTVTSPLGSVTRYERDALGRVAAITDPVGGVTRLRWTVEGKLAWRRLPDGATERWTHDGEGNVVEHQDAMGQVTRSEMTHFDLPAARTGPDGARLELSYDTELQLVAVTNPQGLVWSYEYDAAGNLVRETDFNGRVLRYAHDACGGLVQRTNGAGQVTSFGRDVLGNVTEQRSGDAITTFEYDAAGRLRRATNADTELTLERDPLGRVVAETGNGRTVTSSYDALGRRTQRRTPSGAVSTWEYDADDQPLSLATAGQVVRFGHDAAGRETERLLGGAAISQAWDANHRLRSQVVTAAGGPRPDRRERLVQRRAYSYRPDGYVTGLEDHLSGQRSFDLDVVGRVTAVSGTGWSERYAYDPAGNVTHADWPAADGVATDAQGQRAYAGTLIESAARVRYEHDAQGRVVLRQQKGLSAKPRSWRYTWDDDDRLVAVTTPTGQRWRYQYDPLGRRVAKQQLGRDGAAVAQQIDFTWDGLVLAEQADSVTGRVSAWDHEPGTFRPVTQASRMPKGEASQEWVDERFHAIVSDLVGTPTEMVTSDGDLVWQSRTSLWGSPVHEEGDADCPLRFPGQYFDPETGDNYNFFRYYDPAAQRYQTTDPIGLSGGPNPYAYVPNPSAWTDPLGFLGCKSAPQTRLGGLDDLAARRSALGAPPAGPGVSPTLSRLDVEGMGPLYGTSGHGRSVSLRVNPISRTHAETDVLQQLADLGGSGGGRAMLHVDYPAGLCGACGRSGAVASMARQVGISELTVLWPGGRTVIVP